MKPHVADTITSCSWELFSQVRAAAPLRVEPQEHIIQTIVRHDKVQGEKWELFTH